MTYQLFHDLFPELAEREKRVEAIEKDQDRLRKNMQALGTGREEASLRERYVSELNEQEDVLARERAAIETGREDLKRAEQELKDAVNGLRFASILSPA